MPSPRLIEFAGAAVTFAGLWLFCLSQQDSIPLRSAFLIVILGTVSGYITAICFTQKSRSRPSLMDGLFWGAISSLLAAAFLFRLQRDLVSMPAEPSIHATFGYAVLFFGALVLLGISVPLLFVAGKGFVRSKQTRA